MTTTPGTRTLQRADGSAMKVMYVVTEDWYFCSHRLPVARGARDAGAEVIVATRVDHHRDAIEDEGFRLVALPWRRRTRNPIAELRSLSALVTLYRRERPDVVHHVAIKPTVYGGIAAWLAGTRSVVNAIAGLGYLSTSRHRRARVGRRILRLVFRKILNRSGTHVIVQNPDDAHALKDVVTLDANRVNRVHIIRGSGVDTERFQPGPQRSGPVRCTMVARMVWSKGVSEMAVAARLLHERGAGISIRLVGDPDTENPESVSRKMLEEWSRKGWLQWVPHVDDILPFWHDSDIAVLPTYREGLPKTLLEAAACALPIVATDVPGCREIVRDGYNGVLVAPRDPAALAAAIERLAQDPDERRRMGARGREIVTAEFGEEIVVRDTVSLYRQMGGAR